ncbi:C40 family peptidase [Candidatus Sumerlaeota bacterium]|nr:C40 family peptidase [Candidatus Sumerlaeota bacterium]
MIRLSKHLIASLFATTIAIAAAQDRPIEAVPQSADDATTIGEIRRGEAYGNVPREERERRQYGRLIEMVEPSGKGDPQRLPVYINLFKREMVGDSNIFATDIEANWDEAKKTLTLDGYVNYQENKDAFAKLIKNLGFENVIDNITVLPSETLGDLKFAFVTEPHTFIYGKPSPSGQRERLTDGLLGDPVFLLSVEDDGYFLCASREGYIGHIAGKDIHRVDAGQFHDYQAGKKAILKKDFVKDDIKIFAGSRLKYVKDRDTESIVEYPDGLQVAIPRQDLTMLSGEPNPVALAAIENSKLKLGTKYVWGGATSDGVDCSGLVQSGYKPEGINLGRDAYMQAYAGTLVATRWYREGMRPGDLLYFMGRTGKINHTAIYMGNGEFIQASGTVKISSLDPKSDKYDANHARGFIFAKRVVE